MFKNMLSRDFFKIYFSKYPTIDFTKIEQKVKEINETLKKHPNPTVHSWLEGRAKDISLKTFSFIKNNKHLLSPSKQSFTYQEYQQLLKFKLALENLDILFKEDKRIQFLKLRNNTEKSKRSFNLFLLPFCFFAVFILISIIYRRTDITVIMSIFIIIFFTTIYPKFEERLSLLKNKEKEELQHQINLSNGKIK